MDNNFKNSNRSSNINPSPMSAEEKLKKSMRGLSHMGGMNSGSLGSGTTSSRSSKEKVERKKVGGVVLDLDTIQDANKQKFETKGRRNNVIILILCLLLVVSLVFLAISIAEYRGRRGDANLNYAVEGDAQWIVGGETKSKFMLPKGLARDMIFLVDSDLKINTADSVNLVIEIEVLLDGNPILIAGLNEADKNFVRVENTNRYEYQVPIVGGGTIQAFNGIDFSDAPANLSSDNIQIAIKAIITPINN